MKYNITAHRKIWLAISGSLVALSIALVGIFGTNLGLDFLGGIRWTVHFETPVETAQLTEFFATQDLEKNAQILSAAENDFLITLEELPEENLDTIKTNLTTTFGAYEEKSFRRVDSSIGAHFKQKAFTAVGVAMLGIILFVAFAFRKIPKSVNPWRFGGAAIVALFHDVLIILAIFTVLGVVLDVELDLQFITALLATLGFTEAGRSIGNASILVAGVFAGSALWWIALSTTANAFRPFVDGSYQLWMDRIVALVLDGFGTYALMTSFFY